MGLLITLYMHSIASQKSKNENINILPPILAQGLSDVAKKGISHFLELNWFKIFIWFGRVMLLGLDLAVLIRLSTQEDDTPSIFSLSAWKGLTLGQSLLSYLVFMI